MTIKKLFEQLQPVRSDFHLPMLLMGYLNPVMQYGLENFCRMANETGVDGVILPDLPMYEYETEYSPVFKKYGLDVIFLVTPETSEARIRKIDELSTGFIYAVSSSATTGYNSSAGGEHEAYYKKLQRLNLVKPVLVGFGIKNKETFQEAVKYTNGVIIGSAYIKALQAGDNISDVTRKFLNEILN
jgi:tryptophan synthase alpha chain